LPSWLEVRAPVNAPDALLAKLEPGERDAILLAGELRADRLIVDDREGRREAEKRGIVVLETLGVLQEAASLGLLDLRVAVKRLQGTSFYLAPEVLARLLREQP
jgi:predicted nucleic acid-binding protein